MRRWWKSAAVLAVAIGIAVALTYRSPGQDGPPIYLKGTWIVVENQSKMEWRDVSVAVNAYYKGVSPRLAAHGRLEAPLANFSTGLGQPFDPGREQVTRVEVRATDATGKPVALDWDARTGKPLEQGR